MKYAIKAAALAFVLAYAANTAAAAGFALYEFSARGNAMGGAVVANKAEAASLAVNPALITQIDGSQVQAGATFVIPHSTVNVAGQEEDLKDRVFTLPNAYATYQASENVFLGLAGFSRFGLGGEYGNHTTWTGSAIAYKFDVLSFSFTPTIAAKVTDELSLAAGLEAMWLEFSESKHIPGTSYGVKVKGDGVSWGGNFSAFYKPLWAERWGFGLAYRTKMRQVLDGTLNSTVPGTPSGDVRGSVTLPDSLIFGASFAPTDKLVLEAGIIGTFWSSYDSIRIDYKSSTNSIVEPKHYKDVYRLNFGAEYALNNNWDIRAGYVFDKSPTNDKYMDTLVPVGDRNIFNIGGGYKRDNWGIDLSYSYLIGKNMSGHGEINGVPVPVNVKYTNADTHMIGVTFKYNFGQRFLRSASPEK
jgi:long-chain fatty acid transport protein